MKADLNHRDAASTSPDALEAVIITDPARTIVWANPAFTTVTGYALSDVLGEQPRFLDNERNESGFAEVMESVYADGRWRGEIICRHQSGEHFSALATIDTLREADNAISNYVIVLADISLLHTIQNRIDFLVSHDPLTQLPVHRLFEDDLVVALEQAEANADSLGIAVIGLDSFRMINASLGHHAGDTLLRQMAKRLESHLRDIDTIARLSGDQFAVMLPAADADHIGLVVDKLLSKATEPFEVHGERWFLSASAGISCYPRDGSDAPTLTANADAAMYQAKREGRNTYRFYDAGINRQVHDKLRIANDLRQALEHEEFTLNYQPSINLETSQTAGAEALLRWHHPEFGNVPPDRFIQLAEDIGVIGPLGNWVLQNACRQMVGWRQSGIAPPRLAVNLSVSQLRQPDIVEQVELALAASGLPPKCLEIEITESTLMDNPEATRCIIRQLKATGVSFAIDDFGTGYSSLAYLRDLPVDTLKIDRGFIADTPLDEHQVAITRAIINMAKSLGKHIIAEGIETEAQRALLCRHGCDEGQGFLFSQPKNAPDFGLMLTAESNSSRAAIH